MKNVVRLVLIGVLTLIFTTEIIGVMVALSDDTKTACSQDSIYIECCCCNQPGSSSQSFLSSFSCESVCANIGEHECTNPGSSDGPLNCDWTCAPAF